MELLSPAGNLKHIDLAINKKVDAVYGGLKEWNARNKAVNFSIEQYNEVVKRLHTHGIKFYMTLNTLVFDEEIEEILCFLEKDDTVLPDAFIIADLGLIQRIKESFPNVALHFSTQFGIHNISDVKFVESLSCERAILARELTANEINNIKNNTELEIENFVWGSQCISFSGMCFFGSLINCGNGNRGKCIITCRDIYQIGDEKGHFLYVPDLDCTAMLSVLEKMNIDCIKLEGRRRAVEELSNIIDNIQKQQYNTEQNGYIYGEKVGKNKLYEKINRRIKPICNVRELKNISEYDVFIKYNEGTPEEFITENIESYNKEDIYYVFSEYKKDFKFDKKNISIDLKIEGDVVTSLLYVNSNGEGENFNDIQESGYVPFELKRFVKDINIINENINLYKVKYIRNQEDNYKISVNLYNKILEYIKNDNLMNKKKKQDINKKFRVEELYVETDRLDYALELKQISQVKIIYNIASIENLKIVKRLISELGNDVIYKLPLFNFKSVSLLEYYKELESYPVMFTRLSQIYETKDLKFSKKYIDYTIYAWNMDTIKFLKKYGIDEFTASPELSYAKNNKIFNGNTVQYIIAGKLPLVYTRQCFSHLYGCENCIKNKKTEKELINVDKNIKFKIICKDDYRMIIADTPMLNNFQYFNNCNSIKFRYVTTDQEIDEIIKTINTIKEENYYEKLKNMKLWKDSYEGNILESRC